MIHKGNKSLVFQHINSKHLTESYNCTYKIITTNSRTMHRLFVLSALSMLYLHVAYSLPQSLHIHKRHAHNGPSQAALAKFEQINVDAILKSDRLLNTYVDCLLDRAKCNKSGEELKSVLPGLINSKCLHCTPQQRAKVVKVMTHLSIHKPDAWKKLKAKYAPKTNLSTFGIKAKRNVNKH